MYLVYVLFGDTDHSLQYMSRQTFPFCNFFLFSLPSSLPNPPVKLSNFSFSPLLLSSSRDKKHEQAQETLDLVFHQQCFALDWCRSWDTKNPFRLYANSSAENPSIRDVWTSWLKYDQEEETLEFRFSTNSILNSISAGHRIWANFEEMIRIMLRRQKVRPRGLKGFPSQIMRRSHLSNHLSNSRLTYP